MRRANERVVVARHRLDLHARAREPFPLLHQQRRAAHRPARAIEDDVVRVAVRLVPGQRVQVDVETLVLEHSIEDLQKAELGGQDLLHRAADPLESVVAEVLEASVADKQGIEQRHQAHRFSLGPKLGRDLQGHNSARAVTAETIRAVRLHGSKLLHIEGGQFPRALGCGFSGWLESIYSLLRSKGASQSLSDPGVAVPSQNKDQRWSLSPVVLNGPERFPGRTPLPHWTIHTGSGSHVPSFHLPESPQV